VGIEKKAADAQKRHNEFLRELGLDGVWVVITRMYIKVYYLFLLIWIQK
jgi:hypothetical protein